MPKSPLYRWLRGRVRKYLPKHIRPYRIRQGPLRGKYLVTSWRDAPSSILGRTEPSLLAWLEANVRPGETWLDIGAHYGYTTLLLCQLTGPHGRVFAFEPVLSTAGALSQTRTLNRFSHLTIVPCALGNRPALTPIHLPVSRGMAYSTRASSQTTAEQFLEVALDSIWETLSAGSPTLHGVKIDVQGMAIEAIAGMRRTLQHYRPKLVLEFHEGVSRAVVLDQLNKVGYTSRGTPLDPLPGEYEPAYHDDQSYLFLPAN